MLHSFSTYSSLVSDRVPVGVSGWILFLVAFLLLPHTTDAQAQVCADGEQTYSYDCRFTCINCDLDGISGTVDVNAPEERSVVVTGCLSGSGDVIGFMSLDTSLSIKVTIGNCGTEDEGTDFVEVLAYEPIGSSCFDEAVIPSGSPIFACDAPSNSSSAVHRVNANNSKVFESIVPLTVGEVYFLEITTVQNASCEYTIEVLKGNTRIPEALAPELIIDMVPCLGETIIHQVPEDGPLTNYVYTLNGDTVSSGPSEVDITYELPGEYELCVQADNGCSQSEFVCQSFTVQSPEPTLVDLDLCLGECFLPGTGDEICSAGEYTVTLFNQNGCDSIVSFRVAARENNEREVFASVCRGDSLYFNGAHFRETGDYPVTLTNQYGCDSIVILRLTEFVCPVLGTVDGDDPNCFGQPEGSFSFSISSGVPPFNYSVELLGNPIFTNGTIAETDQITEITSLFAGTYLIFVSDNVGNNGFLNITLTDPDPVRTAVTDSSPICFGEANGSIHLETTGGEPPYAYSWQGNETECIRSGLSAGMYAVTVTDALGCTQSLSITLTDPPPFTLGFTPADEECANPGSGSVQIDLLPTVINTTLTNQVTTAVIAPTNYESLTAGNYRLEAINQYGCFFIDTFSINRPALPQYQLRAEEPFLEFGQSTLLSISAPTATWNWLSTGNVPSFTTAPDLEVRPLRTTVYPVEITAPSGCTVTDSLTIIVDRNAKIYTPTAFSPNGDGVNDRFVPFPGTAADRVLSMSVYNRWGGEIFTETLTNPERQLLGWDGTTNEQRAPPGTYTWQLTVQLIDGERINLNGIINLIR